MDFEEHEGTSHAYLAPPRLDFDENPCDLFSTSQSGCCLEIPSVIPAASQHKDAEARAQKSKARARAHKNNEANRRKRNQEALSALQSLLTAPIRTHSDVLEAARTEILSLRSKLGRNRPSPGDAASNSPSKKLKKRVRTDPLMEGRTDHPEATWMADLDVLPVSLPLTVPLPLVCKTELYSAGCWFADWMSNFRSDRPRLGV